VSPSPTSHWLSEPATSSAQAVCSTANATEPGYLDQYTWHRVVRWIRKRHNRTKWAVLLRRYLPRSRPTEDDVTLFQPQTVTVTRYRYRAANIATPWASRTPAPLT
jgi:hypothetical protein